MQNFDFHNNEERKYIHLYKLLTDVRKLSNKEGQLRAIATNPEETLIREFLNI